MADKNTVYMSEKQKVKEITDKLEAGLKELFESEKYKSYLSTMSKFHNYSFNNTLLIAMQKPEATLVAGYQAWQKNFERHVNKGEKAIRILAPAPYKIKEERDKLDPVTGEMMFDENGMPQKEETEVTIPAFRAVSVFDVSQTDGKPIPELEVNELLSTVEGYEDFVQALMNISPVPIAFEDIPGDSKGYFSTAEKRIAVQENMSESQTLKTMVHEVAHSMLHDKEVNQSMDIPVKDRNTKEVEAESVAFTVCQHFGIDTSDYSFGYIAGWSSGRNMKELKSSLDTIRKTASELITGIEGAMQELQLNREMEQEHGKESILLVHNEDFSEYNLVSVRGMDSAELISALSTMNEEDKSNISSYLESKGAWTTELADEQTEEAEEYHIDVRYNMDTDELIDVKERVEQPIDGLIGAVTFIYRKGELQTYYIGIRWREGGMPEIQGTSVSNVAEIKLTEKGYFIYAYEYVIAHASLRQYWRIEPLPEDCQELTEKYISGLSYVNYNLLVTDWDSSNVEDILMPCMYEDVYRISTGENLKTEGWKIPAEEYERIMTTYFPVSVEQLREHCGYDEGSNSYEYEMIYASPYPPFGEVVDYTKNADGTITLIVDGVWPDYNSDLAFRNTVVVQPFEDGTFRYLSNSIEQIELELPPIAKAH